MASSSNKMLIIFTLNILLYMYCGVYVEAAVVCKNNNPPEIVGVIEKGDFSKLVVCLQDFVDNGMPISTKEGGHILKPIGWVYFNSKGGDVNEAIKIGRFLRESLADVVVNEQCSSACFLAVVGAVKIYAGGGVFGDIGIHRVFYDEAALKHTNMSEYEATYNEIKKGARQYCYDMDVPTALVEKMFAISSRDLYILKYTEIEQLGKHPAFDEWIESRCSVNLKEPDRVKCVDNVRWAQFKETVKKYYKKYR